MTKVSRTAGKKHPTRGEQKAATRLKIRDAAWALFTEQGYEQTTTKQVAERAGVAVGTVFVHASDKPDLLMLVMHDRLAATSDAGFDSLPRDARFVDQLMHLFRGLFAMYSEHPDVARAFVKAMPGARGPNGERLNALTFAFLHRIGTLVQSAQERGEIARDVEPLAVAQNVFALYFMALLGWLSGFATLETALEPLLRNALELQFRGLRP